ncbi:MAG: hypothetical protein SFX73_17395 [Kofleriaceae bacterium]|nr:hypothetical protein [Kofleriaceae bacterium]
MSHPLRALVAGLIGTLSATGAAYAQPAEVRDVWIQQPDGTFTSDQGPYTARIAPDGSTTFRNNPNIQPDIYVPGARFDITDATMRAVGEDPYSSAKLSFLDRSRDLRVKMGTDYRAWQLSQSAAIMRANIDGMWKRLPNDAARKQALFEMWDECAETGDPALVEAGKAARAALVEVAQQRLGPNAFTPQELTAMNARRTSSQRFQPNAAPPEMVAVR